MTDENDDFVNFSHYTDQLQEADVLSSLKSADNQFLFTRSLLLKHGLLPTTLDRSEKSAQSDGSKERFSKEKWTRLTMNGTGFFTSGYYSNAAKVFTVNIINSEPGTENHALSLIHRSAALLKLGQYKKCEKDLLQAMAGSKYPPQIGYALFAHAGKVYRKLGRGEQAEQYYTESLRRLNEAHHMTADDNRKFRVKVFHALDKCKNCDCLQEDDCDDDSDDEKVTEEPVGGRNENIPALSAFLELKSSPNMGRGVYATRDINPGDVVAIDEPYICGPSLSHKNYCHNCLKLDVAPIPCPKCSLVYYCSEECMHKSLKDGHYLECPIIFFIRAMPGKTEINELALKWLLKDVSKMGLKKYCLLVDDFSRSQINPKTKGFNENGQYKSDNFLTAYSLDNSINKFSMDVLFFFNCLAAEMLHYLILSGFKIQERYLGTLGASLVHILSVLDLNCRKLNINAPFDYHVGGLLLGMPYAWGAFPLALALYPSISLFNHSCDPNICRSGKLSDRIRVMKAIQPIPKGSQLFFSYGKSFGKLIKEERQDICQNIFKFECYCQRCLEDWPPYYSVPDLSERNILNPSMADTLKEECKVFEEFLKNVGPDEFDLHLNYLYDFIKLIFSNVKQPFRLYAVCLYMIFIAHSDLKIDMISSLF